ncbi:MAG: hypothetical protein RI932_2447 [Pseudomonadota bacterium]
MKRTKSFFQHAVNLMSATLLITTALACSPVTATKPQPKKLSLPQTQSGTGFGFSGETPTGLYRGGLLIWSPDVKAEQIRALLSETRETNEKYVALNRYFTKFIETEVQPLRTEITSRQKQYELAKADSDARLAPLQMQKAASWFVQESQAIKSQFVDFDKLRMDGLFEAYCEAKILDLATRPFLSKGEFRSRPTPSALCESYYRGRYFTAESCADSPEGRSYYECIWNDGVMRTRFGTRIQVRVASRKAGTKVSDPLALRDFAQFELIKKALALEDVPFCTASEVRRALMSGVRYRVLASGVILGGLTCGENSRFEVSYGSGEWDKELSASSAAFLIDAIEVGQGAATLPVSFQWIDPVVATANRDLAGRVQGVAAKFALFNAPVASCGLDFSSPNDVFFNDGRLARGQFLQGQCKSALPPLSSLPEVIIADEALEMQRQDLLKLERELTSLKGNSCPVAPSCEGVAAGHARCDFLNAQVRKAAAAEIKGVASVLVTDFGLSFERVNSSSSTAVIWMNGAPVGVGCVGEVKLGNCSAAFARPEFASAMPVQAEVSTDNELLLKMKIDVRQLAAAGVPESVVRQFLAFNESILELNATSNRMDGVVPYLSGKAFVRLANSANTTALAEGSVSYLIENSFDKTLGEFCSAN